MFYAHEFWFKTTHRVLDSVEELDLDERVKEAVVLHSFTHLSGSNASPDFVRQILVDAQKRLKTVGFTTRMTLFGYLHEFSLHVSDESLERVFKKI